MDSVRRDEGVGGRLKEDRKMMGEKGREKGRKDETKRKTGKKKATIKLLPNHLQMSGENFDLTLICEGRGTDESEGGLCHRDSPVNGNVALVITELRGMRK